MLRTWPHNGSWKRWVWFISSALKKMGWIHSITPSPEKAGERESPVLTSNRLFARAQPTSLRYNDAQDPFSGGECYLRGGSKIDFKVNLKPGCWQRHLVD